jgi:predicted TIM-barrel enzyme
MSIPERSFTRAEIIDRLRATLADKKPIIAVAAGVGIIAKCAEVGGADLILVHANSRSRNLGVPTTTYLGNPTQMTLDMFPEIDNVVDDTPIIAGIDGTDGMRRRLGRVVDQYKSLGINGISNFPTSIGQGANWGKARMDVGMGVDREWDLMTLARDAGLFSAGQAYTAEMAAELTKAGADLIVARVGLTIGGTVGPKPAAPGTLTVDEALKLVQEIVEAAKAERDDVFVLAHGGPFARPEDTERLYAETDVHGILAESAIERIPVEEYVAAEIRTFKSPTLRVPQPASA